MIRCLLFGHRWLSLTWWDSLGIEYRQCDRCGKFKRYKKAEGMK